MIMIIKSSNSNDNVYTYIRLYNMILCSLAFGQKAVVYPYCGMVLNASMLTYMCTYIYIIYTCYM